MFDGGNFEDGETLGGEKDQKRLEGLNDFSSLNGI